VEEMKQAIYKYGPIAVTVSASGAWKGYKSGVYNACNTNMTNHIVALVGWNDDEQAWILKNSHGTEWGEAGYMRIKYVGTNGKKCNNVGSSAAFVVYKR
jgi:cathepsin L